MPPDPEHPDVRIRRSTPTSSRRSTCRTALVRIIAAYVNDVRTPERETVTLLNTADVAVDLEGWQIKDKQKERDAAVAARSTPAPRRWSSIKTPVTLSNKGGIITLLDARGVKVHGVSYTKEQASQPGRTIPFQC